MIDVKSELADANAKLPLALPDSPVPLDFQIRSIALTLAQRHIGDTCVKEGALYQQLKMDNKLGHTVSVDDVVRAALVFERYLWGQWSKGIAENAIEATTTDLADAIERELQKKQPGNDSPVRPTGK